MIKDLFDRSETTKLDVVVSVAAAAVAVYKALDNYVNYKNSQ